MISNYFKIAWRNLVRNTVYTSINILGLSLGICTCIVIFLISSYEISFDTFHPGSDRIYRIMGDVKENTGDKLHFGRLPIAVSQSGRDEISGLDAIALVIPYNAGINIPKGDKQAIHFESKLEGTPFINTVIADPEYFDIFKYEWLVGNAATALTEPFRVVLTEAKARKYFGNVPLNEIIGKQIIYNDSLRVAVSGIVKDWVKNSDLTFTDFISYVTIQKSFLSNDYHPALWSEREMPAWTFALLSKGIDPAPIGLQLNKLVKKNADAQIKLTLWLEPLSDIHFNADVIENPIRTADRSTIYALMGIALFILILAVINFINLSTALSLHRTKEVGVRKVLGSSRAGLIFQFLTETFILTVFSVLISVLFVKPSLLIFHSFIPIGITFNLFDPLTLIFLVLLTISTSLLAGLYPAKVLSSHLAILSLKGSSSQRGGDKWLLRKGLIIFQFSVSLIFIISGLVITSQLKYTREKNPGFTSDAIITVNTPWGESLSKIQVLDQKIKHLSGVSRVATQWVPPMTGKGRGHAIKFNSSDLKATGVVQVTGNEEFIPLYEIKILAGRNLMHADSLKEIVINENLSKLMACKNPEEAIGKMLYWDNKPYPVVGVVADFHSRSFHDPISPLCLVNRPDRQLTLAIKLSSIGGLSSNSIKTSISEIKHLWEKEYPNGTFEYQFYDESLALLYQKDQQTATLVNTAMGITIFISCIGLFGLALFTAGKRAKEISIRKILGASFGNIAIMLSRDFVALVMIAFLIASPIAWYFMSKWLQSFVYRINISWWIFLLAGAAAVLIALVTVSYQAVKAAIANPVKNLRTE